MSYYFAELLVVYKIVTQYGKVDPDHRRCGMHQL